jgi:hypothetical protein
MTQNIPPILDPHTQAMLKTLYAKTHPDRLDLIRNADYLVPVAMKFQNCSPARKDLLLQEHPLAYYEQKPSQVVFQVDVREAEGTELMLAYNSLRSGNPCNALSMKYEMMLDEEKMPGKNRYRAEVASQMVASYYLIKSMFWSPSSAEGKLLLDIATFFVAVWGFRLALGRLGEYSMAKKEFEKDQRVKKQRFETTLKNHYTELTQYTETRLQEQGISREKAMAVGREL